MWGGSRASLDAGARISADSSSDVRSVLVTGAQGYIGSVLTPMLREAGYIVKERDLGLYARCLYPRGETPPQRWDTRSTAKEDFQDVDAVIHLAALSNDPLGDLKPHLTYDINHEGTVRVASAAKAAGVKRFLFASSCSLYGAGGTEGLVDETAALAPVTPYAETKVSGEKALADLADDEFSPVYLRNATVYGPSPALRLDLVVNDLCATAVATGRILLKSDGTPWRPQVHVSDVARAFLAILAAPRDAIHDEAFNVGRSDENLRISQIAEMVADAIPGGAQIEYAEGAGPDPRSYRVDFRKITERVPAFAPQWTVESGIEQLIGVFADDGLSETDFGRYRRLAEVNRLLDEGLLSEELEWL